MRDVEIKFRDGNARFDFSLLVPDRDDTLINIMRKGIYDRTQTTRVKEFLCEGDVVIDIGSAYGYYTLLFSQLVGEDGKVFSFEPHPETFQYLTKNVVENEAWNVRLYNLALGHEPGELPFYSSPSNIGHSGINISGKLIGNVNVVEAIKFLKYPTRMIKIDTEGYEYKILRSLEPRLDLVESILFEYSNWCGATMEEITGLFEKNGFIVRKPNWKRYKVTGKETISNFWVTRRPDVWFNT